MGIRKWFGKQNLLVQILLLLIPGVNWVVDALVRWNIYLASKKPVDLILAIIATIPTGIALGLVDLVCVLLTKRFLLEGKPKSKKGKRK